MFHIIDDIKLVHIGDSYYAAKYAHGLETTPSTDLSIAVERKKRIKRVPKIRRKHAKRTNLKTSHLKQEPDVIKSILRKKSRRRKRWDRFIEEEGPISFSYTSPIEGRSFGENNLISDTSSRVDFPNLLLVAPKAPPKLLRWADMANEPTAEGEGQTRQLHVVYTIPNWNRRSPYLSNPSTVSQLYLIARYCRNHPGLIAATVSAVIFLTAMITFLVLLRLTM